MDMRASAWRRAICRVGCPSSAEPANSRLIDTYKYNPTPSIISSSDCQVREFLFWIVSPALLHPLILQRHSTDCMLRSSVDGAGAPCRNIIDMCFEPAFCIAEFRTLTYVELVSIGA